MGDQAGEESKLGVVGILLLGLLECVQRLREMRDDIAFGNGIPPDRFVGSRVLIDRQQIGVGVLHCGVLRELGRNDLADLR